MWKFLCTSFLMYVFALADAQIVADHKVVDLLDEIPQQFVDSVKSMLVDIPGESHSMAYRLGMSLLEEIDSRYQVETYTSSTPPSSTDQYLRIGRHRWAGEDYLFSQEKIIQLKGEIDDQNSTGNPFHVIGFGWCWDMVQQVDPVGIEDTVYMVHWAGSSIGGPDGNMGWGLDSGDQALTGNSVCMDTYFEAVESYILHCKENSPKTKWIFTTGPVDEYGGTENGFQREIKHDYIRTYVAMDDSRILFDYADILCWNYSGEQNLAVWDDEGSLRPHAQIHPDNMMDYDNSWRLVSHEEDGDHIGEAGTVRLAKAMWWMLARIAGWDGIIPLRDIQLASEGDSTWVMTGSQMQFFATITPAVATDTTVTWSVVQGTGTASISSKGLLEGGTPGMVDVVALANDGSGVADTIALTIATPTVPVTDISITTPGGIAEVNMGSTLQCTAIVSPDTATNPEITWSVLNTGGSSSISESGLLMGLTPGIVDVIATASDGTWIADTLQLTVVDTVIYVSDIYIVSDGGVNELETGRELQYSVTVMPLDVTFPTVIWSVINGSGSATISSDGLLRGGWPGGVKVLGSASDGSGVADTLDLTITGTAILVSDVEIISPGGTSEIPSGEDLQLTVHVLPVNASIPSVDWSVINGSGEGTITSEGLLTGGLPGTIEVIALAIDASGMGDTLDLSVIEPVVPVTIINILTAEGLTEMEGGATLQCSATIEPVNATNPEVVWSIIDGSGSAVVSTNGLVTAMSAGTVEVVATASDGTGVSKSLTLTITSSAILMTEISISSAGGQRSVDEGNTLQFAATVQPSNVTNPAVLWSVNPGTGSADINQSGLLSAVSEGEILVTASSQDGSGISTNFALTINGPSSLLDQGQTRSMLLYPNPSPGKFYLDVGSLSLVKVQVFSIMGSMIREWVQEPGGKIIEIDLLDQHSGAYFIHTITSDQSYVHRVIISK